MKIISLILRDFESNILCHFSLSTYAGLPPAPPAATSSVSEIYDGPYSGHNYHGEAIKPLGVDVSRKKRDGLTRSMIAVIILSAFSAFVVCLGLIWLILLKYGACVKEPEPRPQAIAFSPAKPSGTFIMTGSSKLMNHSLLSS